MGICHAKKSKINGDNHKNGKISDRESMNSVQVVSNNYYDDRELKKLRKELKEMPDIFVLNNLLLSVMFFENYDKDKQKFIHSNGTEMEKTLNPILLKQETIECLTPDVVFEHINNNVHFCFTHGKNKNQPQSLIPKRLYIINDNIEVIESFDELQYSDVDNPSYKVAIEEARLKKDQHHGFVRLRHIDIKNKQQNQQQQFVNRQNYDEIEPQPGPSTSTDNLSESSYDYAKITEVKTPKPLNIVDCDDRRDTLPETCFISRKIKNYQLKSRDPEDESNNNNNEEIKDNDLYKDVSYISSTGFQEYFQNVIFPNSLGQVLGFTNKTKHKAEAIPGTIFCNLNDDMKRPCEIYPAIAIEWPSKQLFEFQLRDDRPIMIDRNGTRYLWPNEQMIKDLMITKCVLIPTGYYPKRGTNEDNEIEWEINFPRAERYLDTRMSYAQIKCFLFLIILFRTYIEPDTKHYGLLIEHIRHFMYWECEMNPKDWPELRLGTKILLLIEKLNSRLATGYLPNFFVRKKNIFENIPSKNLKNAQFMFHKILQSPLPYFIGALRNLRYDNDIFDNLNLKELYKILITNHGNQMINGNLMPPNVRQPRRKIIPGLDFASQQEMDWKLLKAEKTRQRIRQKQAEEQEENLKRERQGSIDSIDFTWECEKEFDAFKTLPVLRFFIENFIKIAQKCRKLKAQKQSLLNLKQAYYLTKLLECTPSFVEEALDFYKKIKQEENEIKQLVTPEIFEDIPPSTPQRNSTQFTFDISYYNPNSSYNTPRPLSYQQNLKHKKSILKKDALSKKSVEFVE